MWVSKKRMENLEKKIAALEKEQLSVKRYVTQNIESDEELIRVVKQLRSDVKALEPINADGTELLS